MSRIPRGLARRVDRLARRAHAFHRFAHHPLCAAYRGELLVLGRMRICRGCACAAAGAMAGLGLGTSIAVLPPEALGFLAFATLAGLAAACGGSRGRRWGKTGTRLLPALGTAFLLVQGLRWGGTWGRALGAVLCLGALAAIRVYRRRGPWRGPCEACPERSCRPCPGFRLQFRRERAFARLAGRLLAADGMVADRKTRPLG